MSAALSLESLKARASTLNYRSQAFINGKYVAAASGKTFDNINPATSILSTHPGLTGRSAGDPSALSRSA